jgi:gliding motility-associated-like protein
MKIIILIFLIIISSTSFAQTFSNNTGQAYNTWDSGNSWATALSRTINVTGVSSPLSTSGSVLRQINLRLGNGTPGSLTSYQMRLTSPNGTVIMICSSGGFNVLSASDVDIKYRDDALLNTPSSSNQNPFDVGYYRVTTANSFSTVNGENPNGNWTFEMIEASSIFEIAFVGIDLVFGAPISVNDITSSTTNDNCSTPQCMSSSSVIKATISGYTGDNSNDPNVGTPWPSGCQWNGAKNNSAWFYFNPSLSTAKITISGITGSIQTLVINAANSCVAGSQAVPAGGCPRDAVNDTYTSPRYTTTTGSTANQQFNLSGLTPGANYILVVDGTSGAISPLYIEVSGGINDVCCPAVISGVTTICAGSPSSLYTQTGGVLGGTWSVSPSGAGTIDASGNFTPVSTLFSDLPATISYNDGNCIKDYSITINPNNTVSVASSTPAICINTALTAITHTTTGATGIANDGVSGANGLPNGVSASWSANTITISGTPTVAGTYNYSIALTGGCGSVNATGIITVTTVNTVSAASSTPILCINTVLTAITHTTTGATGIANDGVSGANGLPSGVSASWSSNTITISGTPTVVGPFSYSIPLTGGCGGSLNATGIITVNPDNTVSAASSTPALCINTPLTSITHTTTGATGIANDGVSGANSLPNGVSASWSANTITISGTPTVAGPFSYSIPLTGGCGSVNATGTITVTPDNTVNAASSTPTLCINTALTAITHTTTGATGIANAGVSGANGLPSGVSASWSANTITISGTPTVAGPFSYSIPLTGGCGGSLNATGVITISTFPDAGGNATIALCSDNESVDLYSLLTGSPDNTGTWSASPSTLGGGYLGTFNPSTMLIGTYTYTVLPSGACLIAAVSSVSVTSGNCSIDIPTAFTPDKDNVNDVWEIKNIDKIYPENVVRVYNRWGNLLFESQKGKYEMKPWDGKYNGEQLPVTSYYFIIEYNTIKKADTGTVSIIRK